MNFDPVPTPQDLDRILPYLETNFRRLQDVIEAKNRQIKELQEQVVLLGGTIS